MTRLSRDGLRWFVLALLVLVLVTTIAVQRRRVARGDRPVDERCFAARLGLPCRGDS